MHQALWNRHRRSNGAHGNRVSRRNHRRQRESHDQRNARDYPIDEETNADNRQNDQPERQFEDRFAVFEHLLFWYPPAIQEQERRQEEQEEDIWAELNTQVSDKPNEPTQCDLQKRLGKPTTAASWQWNRL